MDLPPTDRPDDRMIEDDEALDSWYTRWTREQLRKIAQAKGKHYSEPGKVIDIFGEGNAPT